MMPIRHCPAALALTALVGCTPADDPLDTGAGAATHADHDGDGEHGGGEGTSGSAGTNEGGSAAGDDGSDDAPDDGPGPDDGETAAGDASTSDGSDGADTSGGAAADPGPDFRSLGPAVVQTEQDVAALASGCSMAYDRRRPADGGDAPVVILAHGFQANRSTMAGIAAHWASWGLDVVTPDLCHATIFDADHASNGADLVALAQSLSLATPIYAGYSAGGLAAVVAAAQDGSAGALLGLDMVDSGGLGLGAAEAVVVPALDLIGEGSMCNESNNGRAVFDAMPDSRVLRIVAADHCDFQSPADVLCGSVCAAGSGAVDDAEIATTLLGVSTGFLVTQGDIDPTGAQWTTPGAPWYATLLEAGLIAEPG